MRVGQKRYEVVLRIGANGKEEASVKIGSVKDWGQNCVARNSYLFSF